MEKDIKLLLENRLEQLVRESKLSYLSNKEREYIEVRIDEIETILRLLEVNK